MFKCNSKKYFQFKLKNREKLTHLHGIWNGNMFELKLIVVYGLCKSKTSTYLYLFAQSFMSTTTVCVCGRRGLRFKFSSDANIWVTNKKTRKCSWSEASRRIRTIKKFRFNTDTDLVCDFYLIMKKTPANAEMNKVLTKFYVWYMYSSTSCIALINCKRGVNKHYSSSELI